MEQAVDIIIQARMGATRLPGKVLLAFGEPKILRLKNNRSSKARRIHENYYNSRQS